MSIRRLRLVRRAQRGLTLLEIMIVIAILGILVAVIVPRVIGALSKSKNDLMKIQVDKIAYEDYPRWAASSTDKSCPDNLAEVLTFVGKTDDDAKDTWGTPFKFFCGKANLPPGVKDGIAVMSLGEDKTEGTPDDIKSWEKLK
jgi:general secretion pathway protein G